MGGKWGAELPVIWNDAFNTIKSQYMYVNTIIYIDLLIYIYKSVVMGDCISQIVTWNKLKVW